MATRFARDWGMRHCLSVVVALAVAGASGNAVADPGDGDGEPARTNPWVLHIPQCTATDMIRADLDESDAEKGVGRGGAVLTAVEQAVRTSSAAPYQGSADLELVVLRDGRQSLDVRWASRQRDDWTAFTAAVEHVVPGDQVRIPEKALGMKFVVRVEARLVYSDGCAVRPRGAAEGFTGGHPLGCGTRPVPPPDQGGYLAQGGPMMVRWKDTCGRRRRSGEPTTREVHARIVSEERIPDPAQPAQRTRS